MLIGDFLSVSLATKSYTYLKQINAFGEICNEAKLIVQGLRNAVKEQPILAAAEGITLKMSNDAKNIGRKSVNSETELIAKEIQKSGGHIMRENGKAFEDFLVKKLGGQGSFRTGGREFDGAVGNIWYEAKSGAYWEGLLASEEKLSKFKSTACHCLKIAKDHGAAFEIHSNKPIPQSIKDWLTKKQIPFTEWL